MNTDLQETYDQIAEQWDGKHKKDDWWYAIIDEFISHLPSGGSVLDVGCGSGFVDERIAGTGRAVTGIDFSEGQLAIARRRVPEATFLKLAIEDLDTLEETFDGIIAQA